MKLEKFKEEKKKKKSIIIFTTSCVLLIVGVFFYESFALFETRENFNFIEGQVQDPGDLYFAYYIDDVITYEMPSKDSGYILTSKSNCTNGVTVDWDIYHWRALVNYDNYKKENNSRVKCNLHFKKATYAEAVTSCGKGGTNATTCMNKYKNLDTTSLVVDGTNDNNLRYIGFNPNNYVYFNCDDNANPTAETCELWRMIGVMNNIDNGAGTKETRIKLIRNEPIGSYSWDTSDSTVNSGYGINEWSEADAMKLLNPGYDSESVGGSLYWNRGSGSCYNDQNNATTSCDFTTSGLKATAKSIVGEAVWNTGANGTEATYNNIKTQKFYELERSTNNGKICTSGIWCNDTVSRAITWTGIIGLMYPSDYGYATSGGTTTNRATCLNTVLHNWNGSVISDCKTNDWLFNSKTYQWTLSPLSDSSLANTVFIVDSPGEVARSYAFGSLALSPVLYLNANVKIVDGEGSLNNPFVLSVQ